MQMLGDGGELSQNLVVGQAVAPKHGLTHGIAEKFGNAAAPRLLGQSVHCCSRCCGTKGTHGVGRSPTAAPYAKHVTI